MEFVLPIAAVVLIVAFVGYIRRGQQKISCPECASSQIRQVDQQLNKLTQDETVGLSLRLDVQLIMETRYRCQSCEYSWTVIAPET